MLRKILTMKVTDFIPSHTLSAITVATLLAACSTSDNSVSICQEGTEDPPLELRWKELPQADSQTTLTSSQLPLLLRNKTDRTLFVTVSIAGALDAIREGVDLGMVNIPPSSEINVAFDLSEFNFDLSNLQFSGRLVARAKAFIKPEGPVEYLAYTPHAFVHMDADKIYAYRIEPMLNEFNAGDFGSKVVDMREWAKSRGIKVAGIGYVGRNLQLSDDDGGPREKF